MDTEATPQQSDKPPKKPTIFQKARGRLQRTYVYHSFQRASGRVKRTKAYRRLERTYAWKFAVGLKNDNKFWSRFNSMPNGAIIVMQAIAGIHFLPALPLFLHAAIVAGCCALAGIGLCAIGYGFINAWSSLENLCTRTFPRLNPLKKIRIHAQSIAKQISDMPLMRGLRGGMKKITGKIAQSPRFKKMARKPLAQKLLKSRVAGFAKRGFTQNRQDVFLAAVTAEGASVAAVTFAAALAVHASALLATVGGLFVMAAGVYEVVMCSFDVYCSTKTLRQIHHARKTAKKSAAKKPGAKPAIDRRVAQETKFKSVPANTAPAFNREADRKNLAAIPASPAPSRKRELRTALPPR